MYEMHWFGFYAYCNLLHYASLSFSCASVIPAKAAGAVDEMLGLMHCHSRAGGNPQTHRLTTMDSRLRGNDRENCGNDRENCGNDRENCGNDKSVLVDGFVRRKVA